MTYFRINNLTISNTFTKKFKSPVLVGLPRILVLQYAHISLVTVLARNSTDHHKYYTIETHLAELCKKEWCLPSVYDVLPF